MIQRTDQRGEAMTDLGAGFELVSAGETFYEGEGGPLISDGKFMATWELIFLGISPGTLHIGYREYTDGSIRGMFSLNLKFCYPSRFFTVKRQRFEIGRADNDGLEVRQHSAEALSETPVLPVEGGENGS